MRSPLYYYRALAQSGHPLRFIIARLLLATGLCERMKIDCGSFSIRFARSPAAAAYWVNPGILRSWPEHVFLVQYLRPGEVYVDVGANQGVLVLMARTEIKCRYVVAIEPHPRTFRYLEENLRLNKVSDVHAFRCAAGNTDGDIFLTDERNDLYNRIRVEGRISVRLRRLDDLLDQTLGVVDLLKIDVEGYEKFVLEGAEKVLTKTKAIYFEGCEGFYNSFGYRSRDVIQLLIDAGFRIFRRADNGTLREVDCTYVCGGPTTAEDLLAVRDIADLQQRMSSHCAIELLH